MTSRLASASLKQQTILLVIGFEIILIGGFILNSFQWLFISLALLFGVWVIWVIQRGPLRCIDHLNLELTQPVAEPIKPDGLAIELQQLINNIHTFDKRLSDEVNIAHRELKDQQQALDEHAIVLTANADGVITHVNERYCNISQYHEHELVGQNLLYLYSDFYEEDFFKDIWKTISSGKIWRGETQSLRKDGTSFWVETTTVPFLDKSNTPYKYVSIRTDITERRRVGELERVNRDLSQFAYVASHDLQEPLRMVSSYLQLLQKRYHGKLDEDADEFIGYAVDGANRMKVLINDLLSYSRVSTHGKELEMVDLNEVLEVSCKNLEIAIKESGGKIESSSLPTVFGDNGQLIQLFQNLIGNALKFKREEPVRVEISAISKPSQWVITIKDNGIGIEEQYMDKIFVIFKRLHSMTEYTGTGIGLAMCKKIVERHGGDLWVESIPNVGSTFLASFPKRDIENNSQSG